MTRVAHLVERSWSEREMVRQEGNLSARLWGGEEDPSGTGEGWRGEDCLANERRRGRSCCVEVLWK